MFKKTSWVVLALMLVSLLVVGFAFAEETTPCDAEHIRERVELDCAYRSNDADDKCYIVTEYACALLKGHEGEHVFTKKVDEYEDHTYRYTDGCKKYVCATCGGTVQDPNGHKNICSICNVCSATKHVHCANPSTPHCLTALGVTAMDHTYCAICKECGPLHTHCDKCNEKFDGAKNNHAGYFYCTVEKACFATEHVHCDKCGSIHSKAYTYCQFCKKCFAAPHTVCSECKVCTTAHKADCSKAPCNADAHYEYSNEAWNLVEGGCAGTNGAHKVGCLNYKCPICGKTGKAALHQPKDCDANVCFRCGGTVGKHLNVCADCGMCNGEHMDADKLCKYCGICEYDGIKAQNKHYDYCKVCGTCGGNHLAYCTNKKGTLDNPKPAWEKGVIKNTSTSGSANRPTGNQTSSKGGSSSSSGKSDTPKTGDNSVSYAVLLSLLALSATCFVVTRKVNAK